MITVRVIEYWNDFRKKEKRERFENLDGLADWIFYQMQVDYSGKDGCFSLSFRSFYKELHADRETGC